MLKRKINLWGGEIVVQLNIPAWDTDKQEGVNIF